MTAGAQNRKILLVDEDLYLVGIYINRLKEAGWDTDFASSEEEAVAKLSDETFSMIALDVMIGGRPGVEVLDDLKSRNILGGASVLILTNSDSGEVIEKAESLGACGYIIKAHNTPQEIAGEIGKIYEEILKNKK